MHKVIVAHDAEATEALGEKLGKALRGGEVIELISDLGGGKTTLTRGIVRGTGSQDHVSSPTFTISNLYQSEKLTIHHFDFYRLGEAGLIEHELEDVLGEPDNVVIVEWSDVVQHALPEKCLTIQIQTNGEDERSITLDAPDELAYLVEQL